MKIGFIGRSELLYDTIEYLFKKKIDISFVYTFKSENYYLKNENHFKIFCKKNRIKYFCDNKINTNYKKIKKKNIDFVISVNCPIKLKLKTLTHFKNRIFNAHIGDLPKYRGNATPNWAIINNEKKISLCIHKMSKNIDEGDIFSKKYLLLKKDTYIGDIYKWVRKITPIEFFNLYKKFASKKLNLKKQTGNPIRTFPRKENDSRINWNDKSADIHKLIRASSLPFDGAFFYFKNKKYRILRANIHRLKTKFYAIPGQVCFLKNNNPVIACKNGMIEIIQMAEDRIIDSKLKKIISGSLRNRLS